MSSSNIRRLVLGVSAATLLAFAPTASPASGPQPTASDAGAASRPASELERIPGEILVGFKRSVPEAERGEALARVGATDRKRKRLERIAVKLISVDPDKVDAA